jgi:hypothetical protein
MLRSLLWELSVTVEVEYRRLGFLCSILLYILERRKELQTVSSRQCVASSPMRGVWRKLVNNTLFFPVPSNHVPVHYTRQRLFILADELLLLRGFGNQMSTVQRCLQVYAQ